jgi:hypothetical protein
MRKRLIQHIHQSIENMTQDADNQQQPDRSGNAALSAVDQFEVQIADHEELLYGIALLFEGISLLLAGQDAVIETYRNQYWNIIQAGNASTERARKLAGQAKADPSKVHLVERFQFQALQAHPEHEMLEQRARILVETYDSIFPGRPRDRSLNAEETLKLMEAASDKLPD